MIRIRKKVGEREAVSASDVLLTPEAMASAETWPRAGELRAFREEHRLTKSAMVSLLQRHGMPGVNWATYYHWERGEKRPRALYEVAIFRALERARRQFGRDRARESGTSLR